MFSRELLYCLPWLDGESFDLFGSFSSSKYTALDVMLLSCNSRIDDADGSVMFDKRDDCVED